MMRKLLVAIVVIAVVSLQCEAKVFTRCELVRELRRQGFPNNLMREWVCLIEHESSRNTRAINVNTNGSRDYGLFQINDRYWCSTTNRPGKDCNITCSSLLRDDITIASRCAQFIYRRHQFTAWYGYMNNCRRPGALPNISNC